MTTQCNKYSNMFLHQNQRRKRKTVAKNHFPHFQLIEIDCTLICTFHIIRFNLGYFFAYENRLKPLIKFRSSTDGRHACMLCACFKWTQNATDKRTTCVRMWSDKIKRNRVYSVCFFFIRWAVIQYSKHFNFRWRSFVFLSVQQHLTS